MKRIIKNKLIFKLLIALLLFISGLSISFYYVNIISVNNANAVISPTPPPPPGPHPEPEEGTDTNPISPKTGIYLNQ